MLAYFPYIFVYQIIVFLFMMLLESQECSLCNSASLRRGAGGSRGRRGTRGGRGRRSIDTTGYISTTLPIDGSILNA